jgi:hypothetical protein
LLAVVATVVSMGVEFTQDAASDLTAAVIVTAIEVAVMVMVTAIAMAIMAAMAIIPITDTVVTPEPLLA